MSCPSSSTSSTLYARTNHLLSQNHALTKCCYYYCKRKNPAWMIFVCLLKIMMNAYLPCLFNVSRSLMLLNNRLYLCLMDPFFLIYNHSFFIYFLTHLFIHRFVVNISYLIISCYLFVQNIIF